MTPQQLLEQYGPCESMDYDVVSRFGAIDGLHYNAAALRQAGIHTQPAETFNQDLALNVGGALAARLAGR